MGARFYFQDLALDVIEITGRVAREGWELREQAEEGSAAMSTLVIDDPDMDFDIDGHRSLWVIEDDSEADDHVLFHGHTADQEIGREAGEWLQPLGRAWTVSVTDRNGLWQRRVMVGTDCNRPAETDVERMTWFLATGEVSQVDDGAYTYLSTATPVDMDAADYRGQMASQVADDCAQASGKNWFTWIDGPDHPTLAAHAWYGRDSLTTYSSPLYLSNDPADWTDAELEDGTSLTWPISIDTRLRRDPSRVYRGVYLTYSGGAVYRDSGDVTLHRRDFVAPSYNVKTAAKATARAIRYLDELDEQDEVITTSVELPAAKATMLRAGMRVPFKATHLPGYQSDYHWMRVLSCSITPVAAGERYRLTLELTGPGAVTVYGFCTFDPGIAITPAGTYGPLNGVNTGDDGIIWYSNSNHTYFNDAWTPFDGPRPNTDSYGLAFAVYNGALGYDYGGSDAATCFAFVFVGPGTATIRTAKYDATDVDIDVSVFYYGSIAGVGPESTQSGTAGDTFTVTAGALPADTLSCYRFIEIRVQDPPGTKAGFGGLDWVPG